MKKIQKGKPLEELVKGSLEYTMSLIGNAFRAQFNSATQPYCYVADTFADYVIVREYGDLSKLKNDEYYKVTYSKDGESYTFAPRDQWEVVELAYQPQTSTVAENKKSKKRNRFEERVNVPVVLLEAE